MTATAAPFGMLPVKSLSAGYNTQGFDTLSILDGYTTAMYNGDVVKMATGGVIQKDVGTTTLTPYGVFLGCSYVEPGIKYWLNSNYWPASTTTGITTGIEAPYGKVITDPNAVFAIQADDTLTLACVGANAAIVQTAGTSASRSKNALDASSVNTTDTLPLRILGIVDTPDNVWGDAFPILLVKFNNHQLTTLTGI